MRLLPNNTRITFKAPGSGWFTSMLRSVQTVALVWVGIVIICQIVFYSQASHPQLAAYSWIVPLRVANGLFSLSLGSIYSTGVFSISVIPLGITLTQFYALYRLWKRHVQVDLSTLLICVFSATATNWFFLSCAPKGTNVVFALGFSFLLCLGAGFLSLIRSLRSDALLHSTSSKGQESNGYGQWINLASYALRVLIGSQLLLALSFLIASAFLHRSEFSEINKTLEPGIVGNIALFFALLCYLPNVLIFVASYLSGPGFTLAKGTFYGPFLVSDGPLPTVPFIGWLPNEPKGWTMLIAPVLLSLILGVMAGLRWKLNFIDLLSVGAYLLINTSIFSLLFWWLSGGSVTTGRLSHIGPSFTGALCTVLTWALAAILAAVAASEPVWEFFQGFALQVKGKTPRLGGNHNVSTQEQETIPIKSGAENLRKEINTEEISTEEIRTPESGSPTKD